MKYLKLLTLLSLAYPLARLLVFILSPGWLPLRSHSAYMRAEYPSAAINEWIDYWEGYITG